MTGVVFGPESFRAVVALHSIIHVPRAEQPELVEKIRRWLELGSLFLATWAVGAWEGEDRDWEGWGAPMAWSHHDGKTSLEMLRNAGFEIVSAEQKTSDGPGGETWLWVLARKPLREGE